jgi:putative SOS response-associated peptidase YedK
MAQMSVSGGVLFEWQKLDAKVKQTYAIVLKNGDLFAFAGVCDLANQG